MNATSRKVIRPQEISLDDHWSPRVVGQLNDHLIKVAKLEGQLIWHKHDNEDEMFLIVSGHMSIDYEDHIVELSAGDLHVVPKGIMHNPVADEECRIVLIEPASTRHTGDEVISKTRSLSEQMG